MSDERQAEIERQKQPGAILRDAERAIRLHAREDKGRFGEDGLDLDMAVKIIGILRDELVSALARVRDARGDDDPTPALTPEQVERANEMGRGGGVMRRRATMPPCSGCGAEQNEPCLLRTAWDPIDKVCDRQAEQARVSAPAKAARSPQGEDHEDIYQRLVAAGFNPEMADAMIAAYLCRVSPSRDGNK